MATDHFCWSGEGWGSRDGFDFVHAKLNSRVEPVDVDVRNLDPATLGVFDLVLFLGVFYHLKDPYSGLEAAARMSKDQIVVETVTALAHEDIPAMRLFRPSELGGDPTNFWAPNIPALTLMLETFGFSRFKTIASPISETHPLNKRFSYGKRRVSQQATHRTIIHAWR